MIKCEHCSKSCCLWVVPTYALDDPSLPPYHLYLCFPCLRSCGFYCARHREAHVALCATDPCEDGATSDVASACVSCCIDQTHMQSSAFVCCCRNLFVQQGELGGTFEKLAQRIANGRVERPFEQMLGLVISATAIGASPEQYASLFVGLSDGVHAC